MTKTGKEQDLFLYPIFGRITKSDKYQALISNNKLKSTLKLSVFRSIRITSSSLTPETCFSSSAGKQFTASGNQRLELHPFLTTFLSPQ